MIPLSPLSEQSSVSALCPPPREGFSPLVGVPRSVVITFVSTPQNLVGLTAAQKNGLRYEQKAHLYLQETLQDYAVSPRFNFRDDTGGRICIPDGLFYPLGMNKPVFIFEIKISHTSDAWWQLRRLYQPVVARYFANTERAVGVVEVCQSLDPATPFPENYVVIEDLRKWVEAGDPNKFGVFQWKP